MARLLAPHDRVDPGDRVLLTIAAGPRSDGQTTFQPGAITSTITRHLTAPQSRGANVKENELTVQIAGDARVPFTPAALKRALEAPMNGHPYRVDVARAPGTTSLDALLDWGARLLVPASGPVRDAGRVASGAANATIDAAKDLVKGAADAARSLGTGLGIAAVVVPLLYVGGIVLGLVLLIRIAPGILGIVGDVS